MGSAASGSSRRRGPCEERWDAAGGSALLGVGGEDRGSPGNGGGGERIGARLRRTQEPVPCRAGPGRAEPCAGRAPAAGAVAVAPGGPGREVRPSPGPILGEAV